MTCTNKSHLSEDLVAINSWALANDRLLNPSKLQTIVISNLPKPVDLEPVFLNGLVISFPRKVTSL